ncbi:MAG TPA: ATP-binding protein [Alkalispirochaeta sp.]|nr:ATP-binding protein [Alkalispirochaeta sp.]
MTATADPGLILLVGDDDQLMSAESVFLQNEGFQVVRATTGREAQELTATNLPNLVLMDVDLAGGGVAIGTAREILRAHDVPIVFLTGREDEETIAQIRTVSRYGFILKSSGFVVHREVIRLAIELFSEHQALRVSRDLFQSVADLAGDIVVRHDSEGRWLFVNERAREVWSLPPGDVSRLNYLNYIQPADLETTQRASETMRREQKPVTGLINHVKTAYGLRTYQWNSVPVFDEHGEYAGFQATGRDITAEREQQAKIEALLEERRVLLQELQHRVKNDLGLVQSLLNLQGQQISQSQAQAALEEAGRRVGVIARIYEALAQSAQGGDVALKPLLERIISDTTDSVFDGEAVLTTNIDVRAVPSRVAVAVGIIVNEVLTNATKHAQGAEHITVNLDGAGGDAPLALKITDDGPGFPPAILAGESYGLGLSIVRSLVEQHEGTISLSSAEHGGARIEITIPMN